MPALWPALLVLPLAACWGSIEDAPALEVVACGPVRVPPARRLSHAEYRNTVRDLFPTLKVALPELAPDVTPRGFDNDAVALRASALLVDQYATAAGRVATAVRAAQAELLACKADEGAACGVRYVEDLGARAFRRPLTDDEKATLGGIFRRYHEREGFAPALELSVQAVLQSPQFLYRIETVDGAGHPSPYDVATRLSYLVWASMPDRPLFDAAAGGQLATRDQVSAQVARMLADPRALDGFMNFARQWLGLSRLDRLQKVEGFSDAARAALVQEARLFLSEVMFRRGGTLRDFLTTSRAFVSRETAQFYGLPAPTEPGFTEVDLPAPRRGFLMQLPFLAGFSHPDTPSPVQRGLFVLNRLMCRDLGSPPAGINMSVPTGDPARGPTTNRQNYDRATGGELCQTCHSVINPVGFTFERFDEIGRWRDRDNDLAVDDSGGIDGQSLAGAGALIDYLAASDEVERCVSGKLLTYATAGLSASDDADACLAADVDAAIAASGGNLRELMVAIATHPRFLGLAGEEP